MLPALTMLGELGTPFEKVLVSFRQVFQRLLERLTGRLLDPWHLLLPFWKKEMHIESTQMRLTVFVIFDL